MKKSLPYIAVILSMLLWAGSGIAVKSALELLSPLSLVVCRFTIAVILMASLGILFRQNTIIGLQQLEKKDIPLFVLTGFFQPFLYYILETYSYSFFASPTIAEALLSTNPLFAPVFAFIFLREKVSINNIIGIVISTLGVAILLFAGSHDFELGNPLGVPMSVATVSTAVIYSILLKKMPEQYSPLSIVFYVQLFGLLMFIPLWSFTDAQAFFATDWGSAPNLISSLGGISYLAVFSSIVAFVLFCYSVREIGVTVSNVFNNIRPVFTAILMLIIFGEQLPILKWIGIFIIIIGLYICQNNRKK